MRRSTSPRGKMRRTCFRACERARWVMRPPSTLMQNFDDGGWVADALRTIQQKRKMRAALPGRTRNYAWVLFRPESEALSEMARFVELGRLSLPIGILAPLRDAPKAFDHVRRHAPGRALLIP